MTLYDFNLKYSMRPLVRDKGDALKYHEEKGMLYLELADFDLSAQSQKMKIHGSKKDEVKKVLTPLFDKFFSSENNLDEAMKLQFESLIND